MGNIKRHIKISRLIYKQKISDLSEDESNVLNKWILESEDNKKIYKRTINIQTKQLSTKYSSIDTDKQWDIFNKNTKRKSTLRLMKRVISVAASIVLLIGASLFVYVNTSSNTEIISLNSKKQSVHLILSDGVGVDLNRLGDKTIFSDNRLSITNKGKEIVYEGSSKEYRRNALIVPKGAFYHIILSDGTKVWLNSKTKLIYPVAFYGETREVELDGEGYFEVAHNKNKPFIVRTKKINVKVLGTVFNINTYADNGEISTALVTGSVEVSTNDGETHIMGPGEVAKYDKNNFEEGIQIEQTDLLPYIAWKEGMFCFRNESLKDILKTLERYYDVEFIFTKQHREEYFTGDISRDKPLESVLSVIEMSTTVKFDKNGKRVFID